MSSEPALTKQKPCLKNYKRKDAEFQILNRCFYVSPCMYLYVYGMYVLMSVEGRKRHQITWSWS